VKDFSFKDFVQTLLHLFEELPSLCEENRQQFHDGRNLLDGSTTFARMRSISRDMGVLLNFQKNIAGVVVLYI
jgi:hypothetical protein